MKLKWNTTKIDPKCGLGMLFDSTTQNNITIFQYWTFLQILNTNYTWCTLKDCFCSVRYCLCESILVWPKINVIDAKCFDKYKAWVLKNVLHPWIRRFYIKDLVHKLILKTQIHVCLFFCIRNWWKPKNPCEIPSHQALNHSLLMIFTYFFTRILSRYLITKIFSNFL